MKKIALKLKKIIDFLFNSTEIKDNTLKINSINRELLSERILAKMVEKCPETIMTSGFSVYSQNEEDGILSAIFSKMGIKQTKFLEFGVHPTENNTLNILLNGGKGCWYDKGLTGFKAELGQRDNLKIFDVFITLNNFESLVRSGLEFLQLGERDLDLLSLDFDGNDFYFIEQVHKSNIRPKVYCLEYNAKFRPPMDVKIKFSESHFWGGDDYFGSSLQSYVNLLKDDYDLLVCNITGLNAFFVRKDLSKFFTIYPLEHVYQPIRYYLHTRDGHKPSTKFMYLIK